MLQAQQVYRGFATARRKVWVRKTCGYGGVQIVGEEVCRRSYCVWRLDYSIAKNSQGADKLRLGYHTMIMAALGQTATTDWSSPYLQSTAFTPTHKAR